MASPINLRRKAGNTGCVAIDKAADLAALKKTRKSLQKLVLESAAGQAMALLHGRLIPTLGRMLDHARGGAAYGGADNTYPCEGEERLASVSLLDRMLSKAIDGDSRALLSAAASLHLILRGLPLHQGDRVPAKELRMPGRRGRPPRPGSAAWLRQQAEVAAKYGFREGGSSNEQ